MVDAEMPLSPGKTLEQELWAQRGSVHHLLLI